MQLLEQASRDNDTVILLSCLGSIISLETFWAQMEKKTMWNSDAEDILIETG